MAAGNRFLEMNHGGVVSSSLPTDGATLDRFYYLTNFQLMVSFTMTRARTFFSADERALIEGLGDLPKKTQALFVRLFNRRGTVFCVDKLRYDEIGELTPHVDRLAHGGWLATAVEDMPCEELLRCLTVPELGELAAEKGLRGRSARATLVSHLLADPVALRRRLKCRANWLQLTAKDVFTRLMTLFFCNRHQDLSDFVKVDLGHVRFESYPIDRDQLRFRDRRHLDQYLAWGAVLDEVHEWVATGQIDRVIEAGRHAAEAWEADQPWSPWLARIRRHGARALERSGDLNAALSIYGDLLSWQYDDEWASRRILCLERLGRPSDALATTQEAMSQSQNPTRSRFFGFHLRKNQKALGIVQAEPMLRFVPREREMRLQRTGGFLGSKAAYVHGRGGEVSVEDAVLVAFSRHGWHGIFAENAFIRTACGLLAWDVIFAPIPGVFQHPFQGGPLDLHEASFYDRRRDRFQSLHDSLAGCSPGELVDVLRNRFESKGEVFCVLTQAKRFRCEALERFVAHLGPQPTAQLVDRFFRQLPQLKWGFPDLVIWRNDQLRCVEVKGPGDHLRECQLIWLEQLKSLGVDAEVIKVEAPTP